MPQVIEQSLFLFRCDWTSAAADGIEGEIASRSGGASLGRSRGEGWQQHREQKGHWRENAVVGGSTPRKGKKLLRTPPASRMREEKMEQIFFCSGLFFFVLEFPSCTPRWGEGRVIYDFGFFLSPVASKVWLSFSFLCVGESGGILRN